jgi:hypothetical protein
VAVFEEELVAEADVEHELVLWIPSVRGWVDGWVRDGDVQEG